MSRQLKELVQEQMTLTEFLSKPSVNESLSSALKSAFAWAKSKFKQVVAYLSGVVARVGGSYWLPINEDNQVEPAISPLTAGQAYKDGAIKKNNTYVQMGSEGQRVIGLRPNPAAATKVYGSGNSLAYWKSMGIKESLDENGKPINEVKLESEDPEAEFGRVVDNKELKEIIKTALQNPHDMPVVLIWGAPGIGKTAILEQCLKELGSEFKDYNMIVKTLSNETPDNFTLPKYVEIEGQQRADDVPKTWLPVYHPSGNKEIDEKRDAACGKGLLFIDELSRATQQVQNVCLPLINEGTFNGWKMGSGWVIICASNRMEDEESGGQVTLGSAMANRFFHVYYEPTVNTWEEWAKTQNYISPLLLQWLALPESGTMSGKKYYYWDPNEEEDSSTTSRLMCTPRAWTNAMRTLCLFAHTADLEGFKILDIPLPILKRALGGNIPATAVKSFLAFLEVIRKMGNMDQALAAVWQGKGKLPNIKPSDVGLVALPICQLLCTAHSDSLPTEKEFENACTWLANMKDGSLAKYFLDNFKNTFWPSVPNTSVKNADGTLTNLADLGFLGGSFAKKNFDAQTLKMTSAQFDKDLKKFGVTYKTMPCYYHGQEILAPTFADTFNNMEKQDLPM